MSQAAFRRRFLIPHFAVTPFHIVNASRRIVLDLDAAWIALGYKLRWTVELFFRWFQCILGCQHLLSNNRNGVTIQVYLALIANLVILLWTGHKPTKRTLEMIGHYFSGWASEAELLAHIRKLDAVKAKSKKS